MGALGPEFWLRQFEFVFLFKSVSYPSLIPVLNISVDDVTFPAPVFVGLEILMHLLLHHQKFCQNLISILHCFIEKICGTGYMRIWKIYAWVLLIQWKNILKFSQP
jgi:hypothetical protein